MGATCVLSAPPGAVLFVKLHALDIKEIIYCNRQE